MEQDHQLPEEPATKGCANCGHPVVEHGYPTPLCQSCRKVFINFPVPKGILIFAGIIGLVLIFAMFQAPKNLSAGIHLLRGKKAISNANYYTAEKELEIVSKELPTYTAVREYLALASFYNNNIDSFLSTVNKIQGKKVENDEIFPELNRLIGKAPNYLPSDSFSSYFTKYPSLDSIPDDAYKGYIELYPDDIYASMRYTGLLYDENKYEKCDTLLTSILQQDDIYFWALFMKTSVKRQLNQFDSTEYYCNKILSLNRESTFGMSAKSRNFLQQKKDSEGLDWALKSYKINPRDPYTEATLALAYHFNNRPGERDKLFAIEKRDSMLGYYMKFVHDVIEGREKFREK